MKNQLPKSLIARNIVQVILQENGGSTYQESVEMVNKVLQDFVDTRTPGDIRWALYATHLFGNDENTLGLYQFNLKDWIREINKILLSDIREFGPKGESNHWLENDCKGRVIGYFLQHAPWDANLEEYGIEVKDFLEDRESLSKLTHYPFPSKEEWEKRPWQI